MTRYELLERIGAGGMAEIFYGKAVADGGFEKPVAIKRILPHLSQDERFVELLIAEAKILAQLRQRNIVQIFDVGLGSDGQYFLVMEFVPGTDMGALQQRLEGRRKRLPMELALHIGAEVCEALEHAHRVKGPDGEPLRLVHRDVSPSNILLSHSGEVKLTDFGIAKRPEESTGHGGVRGKFAYISPEQAQNQHVDARSDVFSLGIVLYELILGRRLFSSYKDLDALRAVREGRVTPPREVDPSVPEEMQEILLTALASDPDRRFPSAGAFGARLRAFRYAALSAPGDPAKELAAVIRRYVPYEGNQDFEAEPTVVRIETAAGFSEIDSGAAAKAVFADARKLLSSFEDEETRAMPGRSLLAGLPAATSADGSDAGLADAETALLDLGRHRVPARPGDADRGDTTGETVVAAPAPNGAQPIAPSTPERAATPTVRELFYQGHLLDRDTPVGGTRPGTQGAGAGPVANPDPPRRRGGLVLLVLASLLVAATSFVLAAKLLGDDRDGAGGAAAEPDAAVEIDAAVDEPGELQMKPDIVEPRERRRPQPKNRR
jgi:hypothetical protein